MLFCAKLENFDLTFGTALMPCCNKISLVQKIHLKVTCWKLHKLSTIFWEILIIRLPFSLYRGKVISGLGRNCSVASIVCTINLRLIKVNLFLLGLYQMPICLSFTYDILDIISVSSLITGLLIRRKDILLLILFTLISERYILISSTSFYIHMKWKEGARSIPVSQYVWINNLCFMAHNLWASRWTWCQAHQNFHVICVVLFFKLPKSIQFCQFSKPIIITTLNAVFVRVIIFLLLDYQLSVMGWAWFNQVVFYIKSVTKHIFSQVTAR